MTDGFSFIDQVTAYINRVAEDEGVEEAAHRGYVALEATSAYNILEEMDDIIPEYREALAEAYQNLLIAQYTTGPQNTDTSSAEELIDEMALDADMIEQRIKYWSYIPERLDDAESGSTIGEKLKAIEDRNDETIEYERVTDPIFQRIVSYHTEGTMARRYAGSFLPPDLKETFFYMNNEKMKAPYLPIDVFESSKERKEAIDAFASMIKRYDTRYAIRNQRPQRLLRDAFGDRSSYMKDVLHQFKSRKALRDNIAERLAIVKDGFDDRTVFEAWKKVLSTIDEYEADIWWSIQDERATSMWGDEEDNAEGR